mgnify:CR=1 FL=1
MRIGVVVDNEFDNDHRVQKQVKQLVKANHSVFVLCFDFGETYKLYTDIDVHRITINRTVKNILVLFSTRFTFYEDLWTKHIARFTKINAIEALHSHDLYMAKASRKAIDQNRIKIPFTIDLHENYPAAINSYQWATKSWRKFIVNPKKWYAKEKEYLDYADSIITLSDSFRIDLINFFPELESKKFATHPNLPDFKSFQTFEKKFPKISFSSKIPTLFYFGVVAKRRGIINTLPWLAQLLTEGLKFHLLIIGPIDKADQKEFYQHLNAPVFKENSTYLPWIDISLLPSYLNSIDIGLAPFEVNPQHDSGVANKLYQYMYGSIPILATECKAQKKLIISANCGLVYNNFKSFRLQLKKLLENKEYRNQLGLNGKKELLRLYESGADQEFLKLYK